VDETIIDDPDKLRAVGRMGGPPTAARSIGSSWRGRDAAYE
jgi:hypothetical protein